MKRRKQNGQNSSPKNRAKKRPENPAESQRYGEHQPQKRFVFQPWQASRIGGFHVGIALRRGSVLLAITGFSPLILFFEFQANWRGLRAQTYLCRQFVAQAVDFIFAFTEKCDAAGLRRRDFADHVPLATLEWLLAPGDGAKIRRRRCGDPEPGGERYRRRVDG